MRIKCAEHWHDVTPTGLAIVIRAFQEGDLTLVHNSPDGISISPLCIKRAFTYERVKEFKGSYKGNRIAVDFEEK